MAEIVSVQVGRIAPLGPGRTPSAFVKQPVAGPVPIGELGLDGDAQADLRVHGGPEKAVYGYAMSRYAPWQAAFPEHTAMLVPGGMGENLTIDGQDESTVCIGDIYQVGDAVLQLCQPRQPCFKFALRFADSRLPKAMTRNGFSGWYFRVLEEGSVAAGASVALRHRPNPAWTMTRFLGVIGAKRRSRSDLAELGELEGLASQWQEDARLQLAAFDDGNAGQTAT
jgi:MOSC domain-containing protein YiiM